MPITAPIPRPVSTWAPYMVGGIVPSEGSTQNQARPPTCSMEPARRIHTQATPFLAMKPLTMKPVTEIMMLKGISLIAAVKGKVPATSW